MRVLYRGESGAMIVKLPNGRYFYGDGETFGGYGITPSQFLRFNPFLEYVEDQNIPVPGKIKKWIKNNADDDPDSVLDEFQAKDEEIWRTNEEGKHFKLETETGEIKGGFGGKLNGKKIGESWGKAAKQPKAPKYSPEHLKAASGAQNHVEFWMNLPEKEQSKFKSSKELKSYFDKMKSDVPEAFEKSEWKPANGTAADMPKKCKVPAELPKFTVKNNPGDTATAHAGKPGEIEINLANYDPENVDSVIAHEAAHQLSNFDPDLQNAIIMNYGDVLGRYNQDKQHFDGIYGEYSPEEAFATGFANYRNYPEQMKQKYPEAYKFFDELAKNQPETMVYLNGSVEAAKKAVSEANQPKQSEWMNKMEKRREKALSWAPERQAEYLFRQGYLTEDDAVKAMEDGSAKDRMSDYFDLLEKNGDPTPTKPIRKPPDLYSETKQGLHNGDWDQARVDYVKEWTGMSQEEAEATQKQLTTWFGGSWYSADTKSLDNYIDRDGAYGGDIYRGMHFTEDEYAAFMNGVVPGATIGMNGHNSSWTSDRETAWGFSVNGDRGVIIHCVGNKTSAPVSHLSSKGEDEILAHSRAQWTVIGVKEGSNRTEITVMEAAERMSEEERDRRKSQSDAAPEEQDDSLGARMSAQNRYWSVIKPADEIHHEESKKGIRDEIRRIADTFLKLKKAGAKDSLLRDFYRQSGYSRLIKKI